MWPMSEDSDNRHNPERHARHAELLAQIDASIADQPDPDSPVGRVLAAVDAFDAQVEELIASFPADEEDAVRRKLYRDADGVVRTRHRQLRIV